MAPCLQGKVCVCHTGAGSCPCFTARLRSPNGRGTVMAWVAATVAVVRHLLNGDTGGAHTHTPGAHADGPGALGRSTQGQNGGKTRCASPAAVPWLYASGCGCRAPLEVVTGPTWPWVQDILPARGQRRERTPGAGRFPSDHGVRWAGGLRTPPRSPGATGPSHACTWFPPAL